jgi:hypothetical protein
MSMFDPTAARSAPMAHTSVIVACSAGRTPIATAGPSADDPGDTRLALEVLGSAYALTISLHGPMPILRSVVEDLSDALALVEAQDGEPQ